MTEPDEIIEIVKALNISEVGSKTFKASLILFSLLLNPERNYWKMAKSTGISLEEVKEIMGRYISSGIFVDEVIEMERPGSDLEEIIQYTVISMVGAGEFCRYVVKAKPNWRTTKAKKKKEKRPKFGPTGMLPASLKPEQLKYPYIPR